MKFKKILALTCAASMLIPSTFLATELSAIEGDGAYENDNSTLSDLARVQLPTISDETYNFTIDTEGLLNQFDPTAYPTVADVYFLNENLSAASLKITATDSAEATYLFATATYASDSTFLSSLVKPTGSEITVDEITTELDNMYVWKPVLDEKTSLPNGKGEFVALTKENVAKYVALTLDADGKITAAATPTANPLKGSPADVWDGTYYLATYTASTATLSNIATYYANGSLITDNLYVEKTDLTNNNAKSYAPATLTDETSFGHIYVDGVTDTYTNKSAVATITNKSMFDVAINAEVNVTANGLTFANTITDTESTATIMVVVTDGGSTNKEYVSAGSANAYYILEGTSATAEIIQDTEKDPLTGSHKYYKYEPANATYNSATFQIEADVNAKNATSATAWDTYLDDLKNGRVVKPSIEVVYSWEKVTVVDADGDGTPEKYTGEAYRTNTATVTGSTYTTTAAGWVAATNYAAGSSTPFTGTAPTIATNSYSLASKADFTTTYTLGQGNGYESTEIVDAYLHVDKWDSGYSVNGLNGGSTTNTPITITNTNITISNAVVMKWLEAGTYNLTVKYLDSATGNTYTYTFPITVTN